VSLRIVVSTPTFLPQVGGAEIGIHEIFRRLAERHDVTIVTPRQRRDASGLDVPADDWNAEYRVHYPLSSIEPLVPRFVMKLLHRSALSYLVALAGLRARKRADVINFHFITPQGPAIVALRRLLAVPSVLSLVGRSDVLHLLNWPNRAYARFVVSCPDVVVQNSAFYLRGETAERAQVVPYGVDTRTYAPSARDVDLRTRLGVGTNACMLLAVQRLVPVKRIDVLIRAMAEITTHHSDAHLVVVGHGPEKDTLTSLVHELGLSANVTFAGYISNAELPAYFASADIFVFHSMLETFGVVFAQAMASGLPIVAADTSCVGDVVMPSNGILVKPFDVDAFCHAVVSLITDTRRRRAIGTVNRTRAEQEFDWDLIADRYERILVDAARGGGS